MVTSKSAERVLRPRELNRALLARAVRLAELHA
jgi:hypothetical protein